MITIPKNKVAVIPVFDSQETKGGIIKASSFLGKVQKTVYVIVDNRGDKIDETDDVDVARKILDKWRQRGVFAHVKQEKRHIEGQGYDAGERCDQGVVKYIGSQVKSIEIGDYVFFSGYTGTLVHVEGEGRLIILPEDFIEFKMNIDTFHEVPGLYFKDNKGNYFNATYEQAMNIMAESFTDLGLTVDVTPSKPKYEDYNVK
jgi:co-chaperonin GroES (HSP10)